MTQVQRASRPLPVGPEHPLRAIPLAVHIAAATSWGRPWGKHSLGLPSPRTLTFKGLCLPTHALRSWRHMLVRAGMLSARPKPASIILQPVMDEDDAPPRIQDLGFGFASDMVLDFAQLALSVRSQNEQNETLGQNAEIVSTASTDQDATGRVWADAEQLAALAANNANVDSVDQDFLKSNVDTTSEPPAAEGAVLTPAHTGMTMPDAVALADIDVVFDLEAPELGQHTAFVDDPVALPAAMLQTKAVMPTEAQTEVRVRQPSRMAKMHKMVMARAVAHVAPEKTGISVSRKADAPELTEKTVAESQEQPLAETTGFSVSGEEKVPHAFESEEPVVVVPVGTALPEAAIAVQPVTESIAEAIAAGAAEPHVLDASEVAVVAESVDEETIAPELPELAELHSDPIFMAEPVAELSVGSIAPELLESTEQSTEKTLEFSVLNQPDAAPAIDAAASDSIELSEPQMQMGELPAVTAVDVAEPEAAPEVAATEMGEPSEALVGRLREAGAAGELKAEAEKDVEVPDAAELSELKAEVPPEILVAADVAAALFAAPPALGVLEVLEPQAAEAVHSDEHSKLETMPQQEVVGVNKQPAEADSEACDLESQFSDIPEVHFFAELVEELQVAEVPVVAAMTELVALEAVPEPMVGCAAEEAADTVMSVEPTQPLAPMTTCAVVGGHSFSVASAANESVVGKPLDPMIPSLEDALVMLAVASGVDEAKPQRPQRCRTEESVEAAPEFLCPSEPVRTLPFAEFDGSLAVLMANTLGLQTVVNNNLEVAALQGVFIQKESAMTEMHEVVPEAEKQGQSVPITSAELQEVAANLSVPKLEADPDDVLSDVQNTLNSLAGMAQGLTQQKQAAGRLQDELEEWNNQLLERERLASDKEERLAQLDSHLKEAKTNLDRMAAENNRLLTDRSEALKQLAHSVDQRDKTTIKRAEALQTEQQRIDELTATLRNRAIELDERESSLKRKNEELVVRLKQLQSAKDKFSAIVKSFNETVQFNSTLSAISKAVSE